MHLEVVQIVICSQGQVLLDQPLLLTQGRQTQECLVCHQVDQLLVILEAARQEAVEYRQAEVVGLLLGLAFVRHLALHQEAVGIKVVAQGLAVEVHLLQEAAEVIN